MIRDLTRNMSQANPLWGAPRIHGELLKLDIHVSQATVSKNMIRNRKPPSQSWRTFFNNHLPDLVSMDFFTRMVKKLIRPPSKVFSSGTIPC